MHTQVFYLLQPEVCTQHSTAHQLVLKNTVVYERLALNDSYITTALEKA